MSLPISGHTPGMNNVVERDGQRVRTNLMEQAVTLARDGLNDGEVAQLNATAASDGSTTAHEQLLLDTVAADPSGFSRSVQEASRSADFEPGNFSFNAMDSLQVVSGDHNITLQFSGTPSPAKEISGDIGTARRNLEHLIPAERQQAWQALDHYDVSAVQGFVQSLNLPPAERASFAQNYMTANFNHPGLDINWGGANLQEGINAVPHDDQGRRYLDCEGFVRLAENLMGSENMSTYAVSSGSDGDKRDHQVAIQRQGADAYVISNNQVSRVAGQNADGSERTAAEIIQSAHPDFRNVALDPNGAMRFDTGSYTVGQKLSGTAAEHDVRLTSLVDATTMMGNLTRTDGSHYHVRVNVDEGTGETSYLPSLQAGDELRTSTGARFVMTGSGNPAPATVRVGSRDLNAQIHVEADGGFRIENR